MKVALMGGMGYPLTETPWGMPAFKARLEAIGAEVLLVGWADRQTIYNFMSGKSGFLANNGPRIYCGDSLGAGSAAQYPGDVEGPVEFASGFQPSDYDNRSHYDSTLKIHCVTVAKNVVRAHAIYDPLWIQTGGLGHSQYVKAFGAKTSILNTAHYGAHPDDWGYSQDLIFNEIKELKPK